MLRRCGLAAIVVTGVADAWTTVAIDGDQVRFEDASALAGLSARETTKAIRDAYGDRSVRVCAIGAAGERGVRFAAVENDGRQAGRGGTGAVFGAKKLKAVVLRGRGEVALADPQTTAAIAKTLRERALGPKTTKYRILGTGANMRVLQRMGQLPTRNFTAAQFEGAERVTPERARESKDTYVELRAGCAGCPVQCEHLYVRKDRDRRSASASEYESVWAFGPNCGVDDLDAVLDAIGRCDELGLDTISTGSAIAFAMECAQHGLVARDAFGAELRFGNGEVLLPAIEAIGARRGLGDLLADGVRAAAAPDRRRRRAVRDALQGTGAPGVRAARAPDVRARPCDLHARGLPQPRRDVRQRSARSDGRSGRGGARARRDRGRRSRGRMGQPRAVQVRPRLLRGFRDGGRRAVERGRRASLDGEGLRASAQRTWERKRAINARLGWTPADDTLPPRLFADALAGGPNAGKRVEPSRLAALREAYERLRAEHGAQRTAAP